MSTELGILKLFSVHENYTQYRDKLKGHPLSRESQWVLGKYESWYTDKETDIDFSVFTDYCFHAAPNNLSEEQVGVYSTLIDNVSALESDVTADIILNFKRQDKAEDVIEILESFSEGSLDIDKLVAEICDAKEFFEADDDTDELGLIHMDREEEDAEDAPLFTKWKLPVLNQCTAGVTGGNLIIIMGRSNSGKTSFAVQETCARYLQLPEDSRGPVLWINNEESFESAIENRILSYLTGRNTSDITKNMELKNSIRKQAAQDLGKVYVCTEKDITTGQIDKLVKDLKPSSVVFNNLDKVQYKAAKDAKMHNVLGGLYRWARQLAKTGDTAVFALCQASNDADNKQIIRQTMMQDSKTDKAGEADLIIGIAPPKIDLKEEDDYEEPIMDGKVTRYISVCKNKLTEGENPDMRELYGYGVSFNIHNSRYSGEESYA